MKNCPYCAEQIQDAAIKCRHCGEFLDGRPRTQTPAAGFPLYYWGYEYESPIYIFGLPLIHIAQGINPETGRPRVARGIIAIGNLAFGLFAIGGFAFGVFALGGIGLGLVTLAGIALGVITFGGMSLGLWFAVGGLAVSLQYAIGGLAIAPHTISSLGIDPEMVQFLGRWWPDALRMFPEGAR